MAKKNNRQSAGTPAPATPSLQHQQEAAQKQREALERTEAEAKAKADAETAAAKAKAEQEERERAEAKAKADADAAKAAEQAKTEAARKAAANKAYTLLADFAGDPPHEAEGGCYSFNVRDRWHGTRPGLLDGWHHGSGWAMRIKGGHPVEAIREDHPAFPRRPKRAA